MKALKRCLRRRVIGFLVSERSCVRRLSSDARSTVNAFLLPLSSASATCTKGLKTGLSCARPHGTCVKIRRHEWDPRIFFPVCHRDDTRSLGRPAGFCARSDARATSDGADSLRDRGRKDAAGTGTRPRAADPTGVGSPDAGCGHPLSAKRARSSMPVTVIIGVFTHWLILRSRATLHRM